MKRFGWLALLMAGNLYGCVTPVAVQPKYKLAVSKETAAPNHFCFLKFDLTNSRASLANPWIEAVVLDAENKIIVDKFVTFVASAPGTIYQEEAIIYASCNRIRQVAITGNGQIVEPDTFVWKE